MSIFKKLTGKSDKPNQEPTSNGKNLANEAGARAATPQGGKVPGPSGEQGTSIGGDKNDAMRKNLGNMLREGGRLPGADLPLSPDEAGGRLKATERLPDLHVSHDTDMLQLLSEQAGLRYVKLGDFPKAAITAELLRMLPSELARTWKVFPIQLHAGTKTVTIAISDPLNVRITDELRLFLQSEKVQNIDVVVANEEDIIDYINLYYGVGDTTLETMVEEFEDQNTEANITGRREGTLDLSDQDKIRDEEPVIRFCNLLLLQAIKERASDIHIEPFVNILRIRYRVDGALREIPSPPKSWQNSVLSRLKVMANLDIAETRRPQDGRIKLTVGDREVDCRISTLPVVHGECMVMRLLDKAMALIGVQQIGMSRDVLDSFMKIVSRPNGILLVTGPTGSGKTTSLYAALNEINEPTEKIITTEDPVEYQLDGVVQVNINANVGLTFARCLRAILRQDPDVILVGEIRDVETAQIAIQASLTGHLVFSTLHTNSAAATISRLMDMGIEPFLITSTLAGVIAQRLVRCICPKCKEPYRPNPEDLEDFGTTTAEVADITFFRGAGCDECGHSGYKGRLGIFELLVISEELQTLILSHATTDDIHELALQQGMQTMRQDGWVKICCGVTTFEEVSKHTPKEAANTIRQEMKSVVTESAHQAAPDKEAAMISMSSVLGTQSSVGSASLPSLEELEAGTRLPGQ